MKRQQVSAMVEAHDHIRQAYSLFMRNFTIDTAERLNRIVNADIESMLNEAHNVFTVLIKQLGEIPLELSNDLDDAYERNDVDAIRSIEQAIEKWVTKKI